VLKFRCKGDAGRKALIGLFLKIFDVESLTRGIVKRERMEDSELRSALNGALTWDISSHPIIHVI
jgi:hypothetical protein